MIFDQDYRKDLIMCSGLFGGRSPAQYIPPSTVDPGIEAMEQQQREEGLTSQDERSKARKKRLQAGLGRRSLLTSSGGGYLSNTTNNM